MANLAVTIVTGGLDAKGTRLLPPSSSQSFPPTPLELLLRDANLSLHRPQTGSDFIAHV